MAIAGSREKAKEALRTRIVEAARDIVSEEGLDALSMRALAERIEYSPATIYLYFRDKEELLRDVVEQGFRRMSATVQEQTAALGEGASAAERHRALGRAYARFALDNTAYFRVMFEIPGVAQLRGDGRCAHEERIDAANSWCQVVDTVPSPSAHRSWRCSSWPWIFSAMERRLSKPRPMDRRKGAPDVGHRFVRIVQY